MLALLAFVFTRIVGLRNRLYDRALIESFDLGARTISIGNITAGGTGKTPLVAHVAGILTDRGEKVCILTRGYGRRDPKDRVLVSDGESVLVDATTGGDEPVELAQKLFGKGVIIIADADRVAAAEWAKRKFGVTAFVLDDGFQHRRAKRDVDIVCIDATSPFGGGKMLPAGRLREPLENLSRADVIVITRSDLVENISDLRSQVSNCAPGAAVFESRTKINGFTTLDGAPAESPDRPVFGFCGLGNPEGFLEQLRRADMQLAGTKVFADHYWYSQHDVDEVAQAARSVGADVLITTAKDAVSLSEFKFEMPCLVVGIEVVIERSEEFESLL
ncbi:MAG: tetraacyldisaccharide 4'-kinase [Chloracidobacterium sp.]|nr:tetraacyldisaccharide 4'-kinase [Chloracidobacterium sp.]